jgi:type IV fimbrial biogenesis protein FimT
MLDRITAFRGHTLTELLTAFGVIAIVATAAVPAFTDLLLDSRRNAAIVTAMHAVNLARQLAAIRDESIRLCGTRDERECSGRTDWTSGLLLANDGDDLRRSLPLAAATRSPQIRSNRAIVSFEGGSGFASPATLTICDRRGATAARALIISRSGRPRVSDRDASDRPLAC